jgi:hypothetical protein
MINRIVICGLFVLGTFSYSVFADSWPGAVEKDYFSENKQFIAHVTPAAKEGIPLLEVFEADGSNRKSLWKCQLENKVAPVEVFVSNDGKNVITNNEWHKVGYGDCVAAFYNADGVIVKYTVEAILNLPSDLTRLDISRLMPVSASSRWWDSRSIKLITNYKGNSYFCVWLYLYNSWVVWSVDGSRQLLISHDMIAHLDEKARSKALKLIETNNSYAGYEFLVRLKRPEDKHLIEKILSSQHFTSGGSSSQVLKHKKTVNGKEIGIDNILGYFASSSERREAEMMLDEWDGVSNEEPPKDMLEKTIQKRLTDRAFSSRRKSKATYRFLGNVDGIIKLPGVPYSNNSHEYLELDGVLSIYLVPEKHFNTEWNTKEITHRLRADFERNYSFARFKVLKKDLPFHILGVTPGKYRLEAVWDKSRKSRFYSDNPKIVGPPQKGDYISVEPRNIIIEAGKTIDDIFIDCTRQVEGKALK